MKRIVKWLAHARTRLAWALGAAPVALQVLVLVGAVPSSTGVKIGQVAGTLLALLTGSPLASTSGPAGNQPVSPQKS